MLQGHNKQGGVMWPRLVANKLLSRPLDSTSFVADSPKTEALLEFDSSDKPFADSKENSLKYKLFASTWNVGGMPPTDDLNLEDWLDTNINSYDIYVLGFQEVVPLSAKNVLGPEDSKISTKWNSLIRATLNKSLCKPQTSREAKAGEKQKVYPVKDGSSKGRAEQDFRCVISKQMVGILVSIWVRSDIEQYIRYASVSCVGCGLLGCVGNKGSVSVRFCLHETSFCFVCCHLASGGKEGDEVHRNSDAREIFSRTIFPGGPLLDLPRKILHHDRVILLGDLNYRISLPAFETHLLVEQKGWSILLQKDQLRREVSEDRVFEGWQEGIITFSPTYKYYPNSDKYYGCFPGAKGEKRRSPAWCDRILWYGNGLKQYIYDRIESRLSDHRPVRAIFSVECDVKRDLNSLQGFFMSDRFDSTLEHDKMFPNDEPNIGGSRLKS